MINRRIETHAELIEEKSCDVCGKLIYNEAQLQHLIYRNATFLVQVSAIGNARPNICAECYKAMLQEAIDNTF